MRHYAQQSHTEPTVVLSAFYPHSLNISLRLFSTITPEGYHTANRCYLRYKTIISLAEGNKHYYQQLLYHYDYYYYYHLIV